MRRDLQGRQALAEPHVHAVARFEKVDVRRQIAGFHAPLMKFALTVFSTNGDKAARIGFVVKTGLFEAVKQAELSLRLGYC